MRLALWQTQGFPGDVAANLAALEDRVRAAAAAGAQLLLCPELWLGGYNMPERMHALAEPCDGPSARAIARLARAHGLAIAYGYAEADPQGGRPFNAAQVIGPDGQPLAHYRKTHLFGPMERERFQPGERLEPPFAYRGWQLGLLICYDVEFPENVRSLALTGAELVLVPTALTPEYRTVPELIVPARANENQVFVAYCNHSGEEHGLPYLGGSCIAAPTGQRLGAVTEGEALLVVDLERSAIDHGLYPYMGDRRPGLYGALGG